MRGYRLRQSWCAPVRLGDARHSLAWLRAELNERERGQGCKQVVEQRVVATRTLGVWGRRAQEAVSERKITVAATR